ncbi:P-loop containing nucleoside triphosphate hydrolase protein [Immersiella caudata]|uniref:P-loop containing nucleoside triphosphate hydrolase protein n=1 Tax=Immersiella caudata TaxID=314043 RepID=A0AA39TI31_9PEZI|nr:P-loop containing nucleoside triphosphate hydrolase protein [Immersiella caudata]
MESLDEFPLKDSAVVVVMGPTGSGKSSFISLLADEPVGTSQSLHSHTVGTRPYKLKDQIGGKNVLLVDTPGFDDTARSDAEILKEIAFFLVTLHDKHVRLAGLIYMHRICDPRMSGSAIKNLRLFKSLCGEQNYNHVALVSTMWSESSDEKTLQKQRLEELRSTFWKDMIQGGSSVKKHRGDEVSALDIVRGLVAKGSSTRRPISLAIQLELGAEGKTLGDTAAGRLLLQEILGDKERTARELAELQLGLEQAEQSEDHDAATSIRREQEVISARRAARTHDIESLGNHFSQIADEQRRRYHQTVADLQHDEESSDERRPGSSSSRHSIQKSPKTGKRTYITTVRSRSKRPVHKSQHRTADSGPTRANESPPQTPKRGSAVSKEVALLTWIAKSYR